MNKRVSSLLLLLALTAAVVYLFRAELLGGYHMLQVGDMFVAADNDSFDPGPATGSRFPGLRAEFGGREITLLNEFAGPNGTVLIVERDPDLSPFARRNLYALPEIVPELRSAGIGMVALLPALRSPSDRRISGTVPYPVLHDHSDALSARTLGLLDTDRNAIDFDYLAPYPGAILVDAQGNVAGRLFLRDSSKRLEPWALRRLAIETLNPASP